MKIQDFLLIRNTVSISKPIKNKIWEGETGQNLMNQ